MGSGGLHLPMEVESTREKDEGNKSLRKNNPNGAPSIVTSAPYF